MAESKYPDIFSTDQDTIDSLPPIYKKICLELVLLGKIKIVDKMQSDAHHLVLEAS